MNQTTTINVNEAELKKARKLAKKLELVIRKNMESGIWTGTFNIWGLHFWGDNRSSSDTLARRLNLEGVISYLEDVSASLRKLYGETDPFENGTLYACYGNPKRFVVRSYDSQGVNEVFFPQPELPL